MTHDVNDGGSKADTWSVDIESYTKAEPWGNDEIKVTSVWGDVCYVTSWHLVREKQVYFVKRAGAQGAC